MSPPGKNSGETTNASVVNTTRELSSASVAPSSSGASSGLRNASRKIASIRFRVALPPEPCASVIRSSRTTGRRRRMRSIRSRTCFSVVMPGSPPALVPG